MKTRLLTLIIATIALVSCNKPTFNVNVELQNAEGKMVYLKKMLNKEFVTIDSVMMQDNNTINFVLENGSIADYYSISVENVRYPINFFSENKDMFITGDIKDNNSISVTGSKAQELIKEYKTHFGAGCSKALSCQTICPVGIETITSIMKMNRK